MKTTALLLCLLWAATSGSAQDWARAKLGLSPRHQEWITLTNQSRPLQCFVVYPEVKDKATAIVMVHEIFGLTDWARQMADELAAKGFIVVEPDLLSGAGPNGGGSDSFTNNQDAATKAVSLLPADQVTDDLGAAVDYATKIPSANGKVAVVGFCWGGGEAFRLATNNKNLKAAFVFYGPPPNPDDAAKITCPVFGFYGGNDQRVTVTVPKAAEAMRAAGKHYEPVIYDGAGHGFMRAGEAPDANEANRKARNTAFHRLIDLLKKL